MNEATAAVSEPNEATEVIDGAHLSRMTLGDAKLAREVLQLFDRQAENFVARMRAAAPDAILAMTHALKGSARGIGAFAVAQAAETLERAAQDRADCVQALHALAAAVAMARAAIAQRKPD